MSKRVLFQGGIFRRTEELPEGWQPPWEKPRARVPTRPLNQLPSSPRTERRRNNPLRHWHSPDGMIWGEVNFSHRLMLIDASWDKPGLSYRRLPRPRACE